MLNDQLKKSAAYLGLFLMPLIAVQLTGVMFSPSFAAAVPLEPAPAAPILLQTQKKEWTEKQLAALSHIQQSMDQRFADSPLFYQLASVEAAEGVYRAIDRVQVDGIMTSGTQQFVLIDGVQYKLFELIEGTTYRVNEISSTERRITVKSIETGEKVDLYVKGPR